MLYVCVSILSENIQYYLYSLSYIILLLLAHPAEGPMSLCRGVASVVCPWSVHISQKSLLLPQLSTNLNHFQQDGRSSHGT